MNYPRYEYSTEDELNIFEFESIGNKGKVVKIVQFTEITSNGYFNLGFNFALVRFFPKSSILLDVCTTQISHSP